MKTVFADTGYWVALLNPRDELHRKAAEVSASLGPSRIITTEMVLTEVLNFFADRGASLRQVAAAMAKKLGNDPNVEVTPQTSVQFSAAFALYRQRSDKAWSLTDCASILLMQEKGIQDVLAHDKHFLQAGLRPLLRDDV